MTLALALNLAGILCQVVGLVLSGHALLGAWRTYRPGEPLLPPGARAALDRLRAALGRPAHRTVTPSAADAAITAHRASVRITDGPLPHETRDALDNLDRRLRALRAQVETHNERLAEDQDAIRAELRDVRALVAATERRLADQDAEIAAGGVRPALVGLFIVAVGTLLQGLALLVP